MGGVWVEANLVVELGGMGGEVTEEEGAISKEVMALDIKPRHLLYL